MKPKSSSKSSQLNLFQTQFDQLLEPDHLLVILAKKIDWNRYDLAFADCDSQDMGAPAKSVRLMVGLHYLKHTFNESDESLLDRWVENPSWQDFCAVRLQGMQSTPDTMQHKAPLHSTSFTKWRGRVGAEQRIELLQETIVLAVDEKLVAVHELAQVNVETTVQEK